LKDQALIALHRYILYYPRKILEENLPLWEPKFEMIRILIEFGYPAEEERISLLETIAHNGVPKRQMSMRLHAVKLGLHLSDTIPPMLYNEQEEKRVQELKEIFPKLPLVVISRYLLKELGDIDDTKRAIKKDIRKGRLDENLFDHSLDESSDGWKKLREMIKQREIISNKLMHKFFRNRLLNFRKKISTII